MAAVSGVLTLDEAQRTIASLKAERDQLRQTLERVRELYRIAFRAGGMRMIITDVPRGRVMLNLPVPDGETAIPELPEDELMDTLIHPEDLPLVLATREAVISGEIDEYAIENRARAPGGEWEWHLSRGSVVERDADGRAVIIAGVALDITDRKRAEVALAEAKADLEQFAHTVSHDLKHPLQSIASNLFVAEKAMEAGSGPDARQARELVERSRAVATRAITMVDGLLEYALVGRHEVSLEPVDLEDVLRQATDALSASIEESGAQISHDDLPTIQADPVLMAQVMQNLLGNAIRFRGKAPPAIHVWAELDDSGRNHVVSVRDNGIGIEEWELERIFGLFYQCREDRGEGSGVGLAECQRAVERHGGRIWAESELGVGTTIRFTIPTRGAA